MIVSTATARFTLPTIREPGSWVSEYALGHTKPLRVITKGINTPAYCAIDASGNVWVSNIGLDDVAEYLKGSTTPHATITKGLTYPVGIAIDHSGNLYVSNPEPFSAPNVQVYAPGGKSPSRTITDGATVPVGIAIDAHDTLYVTNAAESGNIEEYRSGHGTPYRTITDELVYPKDVVVDKNGWLYWRQMPARNEAPTRIKGRALPPPPVREVLRNEADLADEQRRQRVLDRQVDLLCGVNDELFAPER